MQMQAAPRGSCSIGLFPHAPARSQGGPKVWWHPAAQGVFCGSGISGASMNRNNLSLGVEWEKAWGTGDREVGEPGF